jgi:NADP-dependent 3-hydroxy acid dehydrogenase YdfG
MATAQGKVCIITGASSGIGEATAKLLAQRGAKVAIAARRADRLDQLRQTIESDGGDVLTVTCDVARRDHVKSLIDQTMDRWGRLDVLVNNAGIMPLAPMARCRIDDWDHMIDINLKGLLYGIGFALPIMLEQKTGHVINVSSVAGRIIFPGAAVYCATKHGVHVLSDGLRNELSERSKEDGNRIRVTVIAPGVVRTELPDSIRDDQTREVSKQYYGGFDGPLTSEDIADNIRYAIEAPEHVNISEILVRPREQVR